jgi:DNA mismatch repair protein MutL
MDGGVVKHAADAASAPGTSIEVHHLFFNTPARLKFLKSAGTELSHVIAAVSHQALASPSVRFRLTHNKKVVLDLPPADGVRGRAFQIHGSEVSEQLQEFAAERMPLRVSGLVGKPNYSRGDRSYQEFYVNGRYIRSASLTHALYEAYRDLLMRDRHPAGFIFLEIDPSLVDVNVHPAKAEVRFRNQSQVHDLVRDVVREALRGPAERERSVRAEGIKEAVADYLDQAGSGSPTGLPRGEGRSPVPALQLSRRQGAAVNEAPGLPLSVAPAPLQPLAQVHHSFIVAQDNDGMALIDQHAAHERVLFEKLQDQYEAGSVPVQDLLLPVPFEPGQADAALLKEHLTDLRKLGFSVEEFGGGSFVIKAVPALMATGDAKRLISDLLDEIKVHGTSVRMDRMRDELLSVMACHPAIKVHRKLSDTEMEGLIQDLFACRMPHSCPHGRPTVVRFSMDEIKRMFKRM